jgi:hypothetical protein
MIKALRFRFWLETGMATITGILFVITLIWPDWVEMVFHVGLDNGNGSFERLIVGFFFVVTATLIFFGSYEWRMARTTIRSQAEY